MATFKWATWTDRSTVLTTELNSLASSARSNAGTEVANQTNKDKYGIVELTVTFGSAPSAGALVNVYMVTAPDGTNYEDGSSSSDPGMHTHVATVALKATTSAQRVSSAMFPLKPLKTKFILENRTSQAFPSSGSQVKLYTGNEESA
jgi:hypothetical protein